MIHSLIYKSINERINKHKEEEKTKVGRYRAGTTGMMTKDGVISGQCAGQAWLRMKGIQCDNPTSVETQLMFDMGIANEELWTKDLTSQGIKFKREEEIPIQWHTKAGTLVSGRPDIVILDDQDKPKLVLELKQISSVNTAYNKLFKGEPELKHVLQAAHYMSKLGCETAEVWYTNRMIFELPEWMKFREYPKPSDAKAKYLDYRYYRHGDINKKTGKPIKHSLTEEEFVADETGKAFYEVAKIRQFLVGYEICIDDDGDTILFRPASGGEWYESCAKLSDIWRFYDYLDTIEGSGKVPKAAKNLDIFGKEMNYGIDQYSDLKDLAVSKWEGRPLQQWLLMINKRFR